VKRLLENFPSSRHFGAARTQSGDCLGSADFQFLNPTVPNCRGHPGAHGALRKTQDRRQLPLIDRRRMEAAQQVRPQV
jgi:hypothetical protein